MKLEGIEELKLALEPKGKIDQVRKIVHLNGAELQKKAMVNAPYETGTLMRSIELKLDNGGMRAKVEAQAEYAPYVELGTRFMNAQPYMKPAFDQQSVQFENDLDRLDK